LVGLSTPTVTVAAWNPRVNRSRRRRRRLTQSLRSSSRRSAVPGVCTVSAARQTPWGNSPGCQPDCHAIISRSYSVGTREPSVEPTSWSSWPNQESRRGRPPVRRRQAVAAGDDYTTGRGFPHRLSAARISPLAATSPPACSHSLGGPSHRQIAPDGRNGASTLLLVSGTGYPVRAMEVQPWRQPAGRATARALKHPPPALIGCPRWSTPDVCGCVVSDVSDAVRSSRSTGLS